MKNELLLATLLMVGVRCILGGLAFVLYQNYVLFPLMLYELIILTRGLMSDMRYSLILGFYFLQITYTIFYSWDLAACFDVCFDITGIKEAYFLHHLFVKELRDLFPFVIIKIVTEFVHIKRFRGILGVLPPEISSRYIWR